MTAFLFFWLNLLTENFGLLMLRQRQVESRLKKLEEEVRALREQQP